MIVERQSSLNIFDPAVAAELWRKVKPFITAAERDDIERRVKPFNSVRHGNETRALIERCIAAMHQTSPATRDAQTAVGEECTRLAASIEWLIAMRQYQEPGEPHWGRIIREFFIEQARAWTGPALLEAAETGHLAEILRLLDRRHRDWAATCDQHRIIGTYLQVLLREKRPPFIGELRRQLRIDKREWREVNNRERVIRKILKRCDLPLSPGKRGRPRSTVTTRFFRPRKKK